MSYYEVNSFIFKDIYSANYSDYLVVESLPSITKPPRRISTTEIDGRDGSIIEFLGYGTYEKTIKIALLNSDYIDEIVPWLDGSGKLRMSNESDVYYNAQIIKQIDYERLVRYRKADITFLVQPYKYAVNEKSTLNRTFYNGGNIESKPLIKITGSGTVGLYVNGSLSCTLDIDGYITLDSEEMEATKDGALANRRMNGNFPTFKVGKNEITTTGTVTEISTLVRKRWL